MPVLNAKARGRSLPAGQDEAEPRAAARRALKLNPTAVELDAGFEQAEPQADSTLAELILPRRVVERIEPREKGLEEVLLLAGLDARTLVLDQHADPFRASWYSLHQDADPALIADHYSRLFHYIPYNQ